MSQNKLQVIVGGQLGSEGKGAVAAWLAAPERNRDGISAVRVAGPNAGHSAVTPDGVKWALRQIPVAAVVNPDARLYIAAGSEIDIAVLDDEVTRLEEAGIAIRNRLTIDPMATLLEPRHSVIEANWRLTDRIGSTGKGIGAARSDRVMRTATLVRSTDLIDRYQIEDVARQLLRDLYEDQTVQIEGTQGYGLGLHHPHYPQVTSSDCRAIDFLAMAGISPWHDTVDRLEVWVVYRPYPIRVAGNSGPLSEETSWQQLGLEPEYTTVTKKQRRVGMWDPQAARAAIVANGGPSSSVYAAITMLDQLDPSIAGTTDRDKVRASQKVADFLEDAQTDIDQGFSLGGTSDRTMVRL